MRPYIQIDIAGMVKRLGHLMQQPIYRIDSIGAGILEVFWEAKGLYNPPPA